MDPTLKAIDDGSRVLTRGVAPPKNPEAGRTTSAVIDRAIGETISELAERCPPAHHLKRVTVKRDAPRGEQLRGWRYHVTVIFERDPTPQRG